jgi:hypothetical protein
MQNYKQTIISQYANSPRLGLLIQSLNDNLDQTNNLNSFYSLIWNVNTAVGFGLDIWGRIVGVTRVLAISSSALNFGFQDGLTGMAADTAPFGQAPFYPGATTTTNYTLSDPAFRLLILVKAAANIAAANPATLNALLTQLFAGRGKAYVNDYCNMTLRYTFEFYLLPYELAILTGGGVLPRPAGVGATLLQAPPGSTFGFAEAGTASAAPFGQGAFIGALPHVA